MRECFILSEEVDDFHLFSLPRIGRFQGRKVVIHGNVNLDNFELLPTGELKHLVGRLR